MEVSQNTSQARDETMNNCEGCIYRIVGERKDRQGYVIHTSACLCEREMAASCIPEYAFPDSYIYEGKMKTEKGFIVFKTSRKKLRKNVTFHNQQKVRE